MWLQPKVSQGRVPSPEAVIARAESGESNLRVQEGDRGTEVAGSRVAGGWQGDRELRWPGLVGFLMLAGE